MNEDEFVKSCRCCTHARVCRYREPAWDLSTKMYDDDVLDEEGRILLAEDIAFAMADRCKEWRLKE